MQERDANTSCSTKWRHEERLNEKSPKSATIFRPTLTKPDPYSHSLALYEAPIIYWVLTKIIIFMFKEANNRSRLDSSTSRLTSLEDLEQLAHLPHLCSDGKTP